MEYICCNIKFSYCNVDIKLLRKNYLTIEYKLYNIKKLLYIIIEIRKKLYPRIFFIKIL